MCSFLRSTVFVTASLLISTPGVRAAASARPGLVQPPIIRWWGTEAGLPQNTVNAIVQSQDGYLWLGTSDGLARFDGVRFKTFGLENGLPSVDISALFEDRQGVLWIGTFGSGVSCLKRGRIENISAPNRQPGSDTIKCFQEDAAGRLWVGTGGGLRFFRNGEWADDPAFDSLHRGAVIGLLRSRDGTTMWISTSAQGLFAYQNGRLEPCVGPAGHEKIVGESLFEDTQGRFWVGIGNGMVLCRENGQWRVFNEGDGLPFAFVTSIAEDADGTIWAGSLDAGLYRFDGAHFNAVRQADGLSADDIRSLFCDHEGNLWIGTRTGGLDRLSRRKLVVIGSAQGLTNDFTRSAAQTPDGTIWVGTVGGSLYRGGTSGFEAFRPAEEPRVYYYATVFPVLTAPDGSLWWGAAFGLLHWQDNRLADCITNEPWIQNATVTALQNDPHGGMWIGTSAGHLEHLQNGHFVEFPNQVTRAAINSLAVQTDGALWVGTAASGLKLIRAGSELALAITNGLSSKASIRTLYLDHNGILWIGTAGGGLCCWRSGNATTFTAGQGLTMRTVSQIVEDDRGFLWLGCNSGVFKVSKSDLLACADGKLAFVHSSSFGLNDGMLAEECSGGFCPAGLKTASGLICLSTVKGLVFINPDETRDETLPPKVLLEEMLVNGRPQKPAAGNPPSVPQLVIAPGNRDIELRYTAIEFSAPEKIGFRYKLANIDNDWTEALGRRQVNYPHIPPGDYVFHVQACNPAGVWSDQDTELTVTVLPFFWETTWFRAPAMILLLAGFAGTISLFLRRRYKQRLARLQTLNAIERERLRISKDMHDHVGGVLTQVSQLSDMGLNEAGETALVKNRFERIGNRARIAVQALDEIVWATNPKNDNLASFAEYVSRFSDEFFEYTNIRRWQEVAASIPALPLRADVRHNVFLAVREAFNNTLKHSQCTEVWLRIKLEGDRVTLEVEDNGCGFNSASVAPGGNGLDNMRARLAEEGGQTEVISAPGKGTRIRFIFPVTA
jgi:ligand-binding sensor domain-containing protein/signal transduction histidine kinase